MSGGLNPVNLVSQAALGIATGGTSLFAQIAMQVVSQVVSQAIQQVGQQLGLPQSVIDAAQGGFAAATGDYAGAATQYGEAASNQSFESFAQNLGLSPNETGELQRNNAAQVDALSQQILDQVQNGNGIDQDGEFVSKAGRGGGKGGAAGQSWLMVLADALGKKLNEAADELAAKSDSMDWKDPSQSSDFNALSQQFSMLMNTVNTAIKAIGEGLTTQARKS